MKKKAPEILWLTVAAVTLATAVHKTIYHGLAESWYFYAFVLIALLMYFIRKSMRKNTK